MLLQKKLKDSRVVCATGAVTFVLLCLPSASGALAHDSITKATALLDSPLAERTYLGSTDAKICEQVLQMRLPQEEYPMFPLEHWKVNYETVDAQGNKTNASGLYSMPAGVSESDPWLVYQHGTKIERNDVPSRLNGEALSAACHFGILKLHVLQPDYLGLGDSLQSHPYLHAATEASAAIDLLEAVTPHETSSKQQEPLKVIATGYSQGGHASMALQRELEKQHDLNFNQKYKVVAAVHMAGPYDLSQTTLLATLTNPQPISAALYTAYIVTAYQDVYHDIYDKPDELFRENFTAIPDLFRNQQAEPVLRSLPPLPKDLFKDEFLDSLLSLEPKRNALTLHLAENDVYRFAPAAPTLLIYSGADRVVDPKNALVAAKEMNELIAQEESEDLSKQAALQLPRASKIQKLPNKRSSPTREVKTLNVGDTLDHTSGAPKSFEAAREFISQTLQFAF